MSTLLKQNHKKSSCGFFVTGTDTNVGKTLIATSIAATLTTSGKRVCAIKPVASGSTIRDNKLQNHDALMLQQYSSAPKLAYTAINPFAFHEPIAPHLAAKNKEIKLTVKQIIKKSSPALTCNADYIIIEGAGGWCTPLNNQETMADLASAYNYPVILVVGMRLGCLNHALLTYNHMANSSIKLAGWVANVIDKNMAYLTENIASLRIHIKAPLLGVIPYIARINPKKVLAKKLLISLKSL